MRLLKPSWLHHDGNPIFSIDIHPDDTRVVTGGQGNDSVGRVVIWNMQPILSKEEDLAVPKLLCQLDHHNACVNCVRWSNSGKYLCSGGDDRVIIIWKLVSRYSGTLNSSASTIQNSAFGKTNLEQWKTSSMLRSHTGDILDLAWSPGDRYLASASVDNTVIVWDAQNFPHIITTIKGHNSLVKGVTWDPVGKYLASQSDDKTLKIWRVSDWEMEHCLQDPFAECGGTTHVLRLDWSPDGLYLVSAHAMNGGGPTAQIVERTEWKTDKDFVGHRKAVVCVKFNGNIMQGDNSRMKHCCVALGSRDRSVSIWSTALKRPLVVIKDLFTNSVMDLSWSTCGTVMMACSWDGSVSVAQFSWKEIGKPLTIEEKANFYHKMYGKSVASTDNCDIIQNLEVFLAKSNAVAAPSSNNTENNLTEAQQQKPPPSPVIKGPTDKQIETRTADGRRRITPKFLLPPTDGEQPIVPKSGQAIFMQVKCKEDVVSNSQTSAQDWRKSMVSSIENVKAFADPAPGNNSKVDIDVVGKAEENVLTTNGTSVNNEISDSDQNSNNKSGVSEQTTNGTEPMDVDPAKEEVKKDTSSKLVNGNGVVHVGSAGESGDDSRTKTDDGGSKEGLVNGGIESDKEGKAGVEMETNSEVKSGDDNVVVNGNLGENDTSTTKANKDSKSEKEKIATEGNIDVAITSAAPPPVPVPSPTIKKDALPSTAPSGSGQVSLIAVRKKVKHAPEDISKGTKKVKLTTPGAPSSSAESDGPKLSHLQGTGSSPMVSGSSMVLAPPQRSGISSTSPSRIESSKTHHPHHRLPPMKAEAVLHLQVNPRPECSYALQVTNHCKRPDGVCHQLVCSHSTSSLNGLEWTMCTDAPICGLAGDMHRIVIVCENATAHVLDIKGRYAFPPIMLSGLPSKTLLNGPFLVIVTSKAVIHVWNIHSKSVVLKSESLLPLLTQHDSEKDRALDISRIQVANGGLPIVVLNTGRTFMYSAELTAWFLLSDPRGLVSSPLVSGAYDKSLSSRMMLFSGDGRLRNKPEPAIVSHIKLKLATSTEMKEPDSIKQWLIALAKSLATHGLEKELHQLCEDLLGPTHSAARFTTKWVPTIIGVIDKRKLLRQILTLLLEDLKYQDLYSEFDEMLRELESHNDNEMSSSAQPSINSNTTAS